MFLFVSIVVVTVLPKFSHAAVKQIQVWKLMFASIRCGPHIPTIAKAYEFSTPENRLPDKRDAHDERIRLHFIPYETLLNERNPCKLRLVFRHILLEPPAGSGTSYPGADKNWDYLWNIDKDPHIARRLGGKVALIPYGADNKKISRKDLEREKISVIIHENYAPQSAPIGLWMYVDMPLKHLFPTSKENDPKNPGISPEIAPGISLEIAKDKQAILRIKLFNIDSGYDDGGRLYHGGRIYFTLPGFKIAKPLKLK